MRVFFILLAVAATALVSDAFAADPGFCSEYARAAVRQAERAREWAACRPGLVGDRWSSDYRIHYGWRITARYEAAEEERHIRTRYLHSCRGD
jgi:hypothetical protein